MSWIITLLIFCSISSIVGSLAGGIAGLVPGLHPNTLAAIIAGLPQLYTMFPVEGFGGLLTPVLASSLFVGCFLIGVLMGHSMTEIIPTAMLGVTDDETVVAQLPSQRLYGIGRADLVIEAAVVGGIGAVALFALAFLPLHLLMGHPVELYSAIKPVMGFVLLGISAFVLLTCNGGQRLLLSVGIFLLSGIIGIAVLTVQLPTQITGSIFGGIWPGDPSSFLLPAFSGFFAVPALLFSSGKKTESRCLFSSGEKMRAQIGKPLLRSLFPSILVGWIPGITNAYATSLVTFRRRSQHRSIESSFQYLITYSATNVGGSLQSIIAMATIFRARNGTLESINDHFSNSVLGWFDGFDPPIAVLSFCWAACVGAIVGAWSCILLGRRTLNGSPGGSHKIIRLSMLASIVVLVMWSSGPVGLIVLFTCFILGAWSLFKCAPRVHLMGFILLPVMVYFFS